MIKANMHTSDSGNSLLKAIVAMIGSIILSNPLHAEVDEQPALDVQVFRELGPGDHAAVGKSIEFNGSEISLEREPILTAANIIEPHALKRYGTDILSMKIDDPIALEKLNCMVGSNVHLVMFINNKLFSVGIVNSRISREMWSSSNIVSSRK